MEPSEYAKMYDLEKDYWWFVVKRKIVKDNLPAQKNGVKLLDIGCGTGIIAQELGEMGYDVQGLDVMPAALEFCKKRGLKNLTRGSVLSLPFENSSFEVVICLDVLYHKQIKNDVAAMREIFRVLKPGGLLVITDSACPALYSRHDIFVHARERYTLKELCKRLTLSGFEIGRASYFNSLLFPMIFVMRKIDAIVNKGKPVTSSDVTGISLWLNKLLKAIFLFESGLLKRINFPFGVSVLCLARKPNT